MKKLIKIALVLVVLAVAALGFVAWKVRALVNEDELVRVIEQHLNCRAHIGGLEVSLLGGPARVALTEVRLAPRDGEVGKPLAERAPLGEVPVEIATVRMALDLGGVFDRHLDVRELMLVDPRVELTLLEEGGNTLDELLRSPEGVKAEAAKEPRPGASGGGNSGETLNVAQLGILASLHGVGVRNGTIKATVEKTGMVLAFSRFDALLRDLDIDPADLSGLTTEVDLSGALRIDPGGDEERSYGTLVFSGPVQTRFFEPSTGDLAIVADADLALADESFLSTDIPVVQKAWGSLRKLEHVGIKIGPLPETATFGRSKSLAMHYEEQRVTLAKELSVWIDDWELAVAEGMWIQTETDEHRASGELVASQKVSARSHDKLQGWLGKFPKEIRPEAVAAFDEQWFRGDRLFAHVESAGLLSDPDLDLVNKLPDFEDIARKAATRFATDKLKDLFGR